MHINPQQYMYHQNIIEQKRLLTKEKLEQNKYCKESVRIDA